MTFYPTITIQSLPGLQVEVNVPGLTYNSIIEALGPVSLIVQTLYYNAGSFLQFNNPLQYNGYDMNGNVIKFSVTTVINANQFYPSMFVSLKGQDFTFDGQSYINFNLLAGQIINLILFGDRKMFRKLLDRIPVPSNFEQLQKTMDIKPGFFDKYYDLLV